MAGRYQMAKVLEAICVEQNKTSLRGSGRHNRQAWQGYRRFWSSS